MDPQLLLPAFEQFDASLLDSALLSMAAADAKMATSTQQQQQNFVQPAPHPLLLNFTSIQQQDGMSDFSSTTGDEDMSGLESSLPLSHGFDFFHEMVPGSPDTDASSPGSAGSPYVHFSNDYCPSPLGPNAETSPDGTRPVRQVRLQGSIRRRYEQLMPELAAENKKKLNKRKKKAPLDLSKLTKADKEALEVDRLEKNRQSARDCRLRKKFYIKSLEQKVEEFEEREQQRLVELDQANRELEEVRKRYELLLKHYQQVQPFAAVAQASFPQ